MALIMASQSLLTTGSLRQSLRVTRARGASRLNFKTVAPVGDRVFIKVDSSEETSVGGILLPTSAQKKPTRGSVVGLGKAKAVKEHLAGKQSKTENPQWLLVFCCALESQIRGGADEYTLGDKGGNSGIRRLSFMLKRGWRQVVYSKYAGTDIKLQGTEYVILKEDDVIGILATDNIVDLKPLGDRILIEVAEGDSKTAGGVLLTASSSEKPTIGKVIAVGAGKEDEDGKVVAPNLKAGDVVLYSKYSGTEFAGKDDKEYVVVKETDVLATIA
eukprot:jgi/Botrbrau1/15278/Bobra.97_1s0004.1